MGGFWSLLIDIRIWLYGLPFLLRVIYIINIFVFGGLLSYWGILFCGYMVGFFFVLGFLFACFLGYGIGSSWILWKKVIYKYIKNTNKKIIPVLERNLGMGFDSLGRVINRYVRVMIK